MADVKNRVLSAATSLYLEEGLTGLSMRKVAKLAGVSTMASYRHFETKDHLLHALQVHAVKRYRDEYLMPTSRIEKSWDAMSNAMRAYAQFATKETNLFKIGFLSTESVAGIRNLTLEGQQTFDDTFAISRAITVRIVGEKNATQETLRAWSMTHGLVALHLAGRLAFLEVDFMKFYCEEVANYLKLLKSRTS